MSLDTLMYNPVTSPFGNYMNSVSSLLDAGYENDIFAGCGPMGMNGSLFGMNYGNYGSFDSLGGYNNYGYNSVPFTGAAVPGGNMYDFYSQQRSDQAKFVAPDNGVKFKIMDLQREIGANNYDKTSVAYKQLVASVQAKYPNLSAEEAKNMARTEYMQNTGTDIAADMEANGNSAFGQGFVRGIPILGLFADKKTTAENIAEVTGQPVDRGAQGAKTVGGVVGGVAGGAAIAAATTWWTGPLYPLCVIAGGAIGGLAGIIQNKRVH